MHSRGFVETNVDALDRSQRSEKKMKLSYTDNRSMEYSELECYWYHVALGGRWWHPDGQADTGGLPRQPRRDMVGQLPKPPSSWGP